MSRVRARRRFGALTASLLAALLTLAAAGGGSLSGVGGCAPADRAADRSPDNTTLACAACRLRGEMKQIRLAAIREQVLAKLQFSQAPNTTGVVLPDVPQDMMTQYKREQERSPEPEMQGDEPPAAKYLRHRDVDRAYATTDRIVAFPQYGYGSEEARTCAGNTDRRHHHPLANQGNWMATGGPMPFLDADVPPWNYYQNRCRSPRGSYQVAGPTLAQQSGYSAAHHLQPAERPLRNLAEAQPVAVPQEKVLNGRSESRNPSQNVVAPTIEKRSEPATPIPATKAVPLPAFQQAFGSTEIGRFSEAFIRSEEALGEGAITEEMVSRAIRSQLPGDEWKEAYFQMDARAEDAD